MTFSKFHPSKQTYPLFLVLGLAACVRLLYLYLYQGLPDWDQLTIDNYYYHNWAQTIARGNIFGETTYFRAPFYTFVLAFFYALIEPSLWAARFLGLAIGLASVYMTFRLGEKLSSRTVGLIAAMIHAFYPAMLYFESELLADPLFVLLLQIAFFQILNWREKPSQKLLFLVSALFSLSALTRPTALLFLPLLATLVIRLSGTRRETLMNLAVLALAALLVIGPVTLRNRLVGDESVLIASQGGINFFIGNNETADGVSAFLPEPLGFNWQYADIAFFAEKTLGEKLSPGKVSDYWTDRAFQWIFENPFSFFKLTAKKLLLNFSNREIANNRVGEPKLAGIFLLTSNPLRFGLIFPFAVLGIVITYKDRRQARLLVLWWGLFIALGSLFFITSRFRLPLLPFYFIFAAIAIQAMFQSRFRLFGSHWKYAAAFILALATSWLPIKISAHSHVGLLQTTKGLFHYNRGEYQQALTYFSQTLQIDSTIPEANFNLGNVHFRLNNTDSARFYYERERRTNPLRGKSYINLASLSLIGGKTAEAKRIIEQALLLRPYDPIAQNIRLRIAAATEPVDSFMSITKDAIQDTDSNLQLINEAAAILTASQVLDFAREILDASLAVTPPPLENDFRMSEPDFFKIRSQFSIEKAKVYFQLGFISGRQGRFSDAVSYSRQAIAYDSLLSAAYVNLISGLVSTGENLMADSVLNESLRRFPNDSLLMEIKAQLRQ
ncbi:MAG: glycosyltransferase family 39 protein [candidate division Zixibacteria bacterium]|nr:glycosyltransferase family 39 protein [candidate division Zixibacteria bacterium]